MERIFAEATPLTLSGASVPPPRTFTHAALTRLDEEYEAKLRAAVAKTNQSRTKLIRLVLEAWLDRALLDDHGEE